MGMAASGLTAILDIDTEQDRLRRSSSAAVRPIANASERDSIGWGASRQRSRGGIIRIANSVDDCARPIGAARVQVGIHAGAGQRIEQPGVEVALRATTQTVPHMRPPAMDARIACLILRGHGAIGLPERCADLAAMRGVPRVGRVQERSVLPAATGHSRGIRQNARGAA